MKRGGQNLGWRSVYEAHAKTGARRVDPRVRARTEGSVDLVRVTVGDAVSCRGKLITPHIARHYRDRPIL